MKTLEDWLADVLELNGGKCGAGMERGSGKLSFYFMSSYTLGSSFICFGVLCEQLVIRLVLFEF